MMAQLPPETRLAAPTFDPVAADVYERALAAIEADGIPFLLGGALALHAHTGIWRDTKDVDLFCKPSDAPRLLAALRKAGFSTEVVYGSWLGKGWIGEVFVDVIWRNANALFPVTDGWFERRETVRLFGRDLPVVPLEESVIAKMMVGGRYRYDGADLMHVFYAAGDRMDWERLARLAGEHIELLLGHLHTFRWGYPGWRDKVPLSVVERYHELAKRSDSSYGPFRARLLDIQSFQVDVEGWGMPDPHRQVLEEIFGDADGRS